MLKRSLIFILINLISIASFAYEIKTMIIDTGIDYHHDMIKSHINELDLLIHRDDYIDGHGHGTHVAGIILKDTCPQVKLYSCKFYNITTGDWSLLISCYKRAYDEHMDFINLSGGGEGFSQTEYDALKQLSTIPVTIVVAAGNMDPMTKKVVNLGSPCYGYWPACDAFPNIIVVGNLRQDSSINETSNYGKPGMVWEMGTNVWSAAPNNKMTYMTGTSQATAKRTNRLLKQRCEEINK